MWQSKLEQNLASWQHAHYIWRNGFVEAVKLTGELIDRVQNQMLLYCKQRYLRTGSAASC